VALSILLGCAPPQCGPTFGDPAEEAQDLRALQQALGKAGPLSFSYTSHAPDGTYEIDVHAPDLSHLRATAVHGHEADLVDESPLGYYNYRETEGVSSELRRIWNAIYQRNHPHDSKKDLTTLRVVDSRGNYRIGISVPQCAVP